VSPFTIGKLERLRPKTRLRKLIILLLAAERDLARNRKADLSLFRSLADSRIVREALPPVLLGKLRELNSALLAGEPDIRHLSRLLNSFRHAILRHLGMEPAEWDLHALEDPAAESGRRRILPIRCYLEDIRSPYNVGAIFRTADAFGVGEIILSPDTPLPTNRRAVKTARGSTQWVPWRVSGLSGIGGGNILALETGGVPLSSAELPESGTVLLGSEELGLSPEALRMASHRVSIPMSGAKRSLNVAVAFGILMWEWHRQLAPAPGKTR
jgi:TrmH family RNA methyltransferase